MTVTVRDAFEESVDLNTRVHVVDAPRGLYDEEAAHHEAETRRTSVQRRREQLAHLVSRLRALRDAASAMRQFAERHNELTESELTREIASTRQDLAVHETRLEAMKRDYRGADAQVQELENGLETLGEERTIIVGSLARLEPIATAEASLSTWREQMRSAAKRVKDARESAAERRLAVKKAQQESRRLATEAETHRAEVGRHAERLRELGLTQLDAADHQPPAEAVEVLVYAHERAKDAYERDRADLAVESDLASERQQLAQVEASLSRFAEPTRARARDLLADVGVDNATERAHQHDLATNAVKSAERELWKAEEDVEAAEGALRQLNTASGDRGPLDVEAPATAQAARALHERLLGAAENERRARGEAERRRDAADKARDGAKAREQQFSAHVRRLSHESMLVPLRLLDRTLAIPDDIEPFVGDSEQASRAVETAASKLQRLAADLGEARNLRSQEVRKVVDLAKERRYDDLARNSARENLVSRLSITTSLAPESRRLAQELRDRKLTIDRDLEEITRPPSAFRPAAQCGRRPRTRLASRHLTHATA